MNQVEDLFNGFGQWIQQYQSASGAVDTSTTPSVQYTYTDASSGNNSFLTGHRLSRRLHADLQLRQRRRFGREPGDLDFGFDRHAAKLHLPWPEHGGWREPPKPDVTEAITLDQFGRTSETSG